MGEENREVYTIIYPSDFYVIYYAGGDPNKIGRIERERLFDTLEDAIQNEIDISPDPLGASLQLRRCWVIHGKTKDNRWSMSTIEANVIATSIFPMEDYLDSGDTSDKVHLFLSKYLTKTS